MERQRIGFLVFVVFLVIVDRVVTGPVRRLERQPVTAVLDDPLIGAQAE